MRRGEKNNALLDRLLAVSNHNRNISGLPDRQNQARSGLVLIEKKKRFTRASYRHFVEVKRCIDLTKIRVSISRDFFQAS